MANVRDNKRVQFTKSELRKSILSLLLKKPVNRITVKEICSTAGLNRGTFYAHYASPEQLLFEIETDFYVDMVSQIATFQQAEDVPRILCRVLEALRERRELSAAIFGPYGDQEFLSKLVSSAHDICISQWSAVSPDVDPDVLEKTYSFISYGVMRLTQDWLADGAVEPPEKLAMLMNDLCNYGVGAVVDLSKVTPPGRHFYGAGKFKDGKAR